MNIMHSTLLKMRDFFPGQLACHFRRPSHHHTSIRDRLIFKHKTSRCNKTVLSDHTFVHHDRAHSNQGIITDLASVNNRIMSDGHMISKDCRIYLRCMNCAVILHIRSLSNDDRIIIATQNCTKKHRAVCPDTDIPDHHRFFYDIR